MLKEVLKNNMKIEVLNIERIENNDRLKGVATIELKGEEKPILKIAGLKIMRGVHGCYCVCPNASYKEKGLRKWENIITFEQSLWKRVQEEILKRYEEKERGDGGK